MAYLFIGQDSFSKDLKLEKIKEEVFSKEVEQFNFDCLYARELDLLKLQEVLLRLPLKAKKRLILIRDADKLKDNIKEYLIGYFKKPSAHVLLILDINHVDKNDVFFQTLSKYLKIFRFEEEQAPDTFKLSEEIDRKRINSSLRILSALLLNAERPERIMGGLRYHWQKSYLPYQERNRRLKLLLNCDIDIKTGKLKPAFALERLLINLCCYPH
jgi:DNA polymerase III delta subunit